MKLFRFTCLHILGCTGLLLLSTGLFAQAEDDIQINAAFSSSIDLTVTDGTNINFTIATMGEYTGGVASPYDYYADFEVNASQDFQVALSSTAFTDGNGNTLDAGNFGYRLIDNGTYESGTHHLLLGGSGSPSALAILGPPQVIITATGDGNAGPASANAYRIHFELGTPETRALSGLPTLLDQGIVPGIYTGVVTLTASAMP